jgi:hypothetical protein
MHSARALAINLFMPRPPCPSRRTVATRLDHDFRFSVAGERHSSSFTLEQEVAGSPRFAADAAAIDLMVEKP